MIAHLHLYQLQAASGCWDACVDQWVLGPESEMENEFVMHCVDQASGANIKEIAEEVYNCVEEECNKLAP